MIRLPIYKRISQKYSDICGVVIKEIPGINHPNFSILKQRLLGLHR